VGPRKELPLTDQLIEENLVKQPPHRRGTWEKRGEEKKKKRRKKEDLEAFHPQGHLVPDCGAEKKKAQGRTTSGEKKWGSV